MKVIMTKRSASILLTIVAVSVALTGTALATAPSGIVSASVVARGNFTDSVDVKFKVHDGREEVSNVRDAQQTVMQQIVIGPGGNTGWHSHPGPVVVIVKAGVLTLYDGDDSTCTGRAYAAGQVFIDAGQGHVHIARNLSLTENVELWVTYFDVPTDAPFRLDAPDPGNCGF